MPPLAVLIQYLLPGHALSRLAGRLARSRRLRGPLIRAFIRYYRVDMSEALIEEPLRYANFNDFFTRALKPDARPVSTASDSIASPVDGTISQCGAIDGDELVQAKGRRYRLKHLLADESGLADSFRGGSFFTIYLAPRDYHRVHMPLSGRLRRTIYVPGSLFSVNPATTAAVDRLFARNERLVCLFDTQAGCMALVFVGAMIVAGIDTVWAGQVCPGGKPRRIAITDFAEQAPQLASGAEAGRFKAGSTTVLLFANRVTVDPALQAGTQVRMGQTLGKLCE